MAAVRKDLLRAIALESEFNHVLPEISRHVVDAVVVVKGLFLDQNIPIERIERGSVRHTW